MSISAWSTFSPCTTGWGCWKPTPPDYKPALYPLWSAVTPFALKTADQFRPGPPPALTDAAYTAAFKEFV